MLLRTTTGRENFKGGRSEYACHVMPTTTVNLPRPALLSDVAGAAIQAANISCTSHVRQPAHSGSMVDLGSWIVATYDIPADVILKITGKKTTAGSSINASSNINQNAAMLIRMREQAALNRIECWQVPNSGGTFHGVLFEGRFDILTLRDAVRNGVQLNTMQAREYTNDGALASLFTIHELEAEIAPQRRVEETVFQSEDGQQTRVQTTRRARAVDLD